MQIGIDLGATKIEYVLLDNNNKEIKRDRIPTPSDYQKTLLSLEDIIKKLDNKNENFNVGICHPGAVDKTSGLIKNAHNSLWLNSKNLIKDLKKNIKNNILTDNDANCFCLSESFDGSASNYETVFGIILGSGCGGGLVINKKIIQGANGLGGEWSLNHTPLFNVPNLEPGQINNFNNRIEGYLSGKSIEKRYYEKFNKNLSAKEIFSGYRKKNNNEFEFIINYKDILSRCLITIITTLAADAVIQEGLVNIFWFRNYLRIIVSSYAEQMGLKVRLRPYRRIKSIGLQIRRSPLVPD